MMPNAMDLAIKSMMEDAVTQAVTALSAKHGFELDVALRDLNLGELKLVRKRGPSPKAEKSKGKKASADKPKKKRGTNGYLQFSDAHRPEVRSEMEGKLEVGAKLAPQDVVKKLADRWKAASAAEQTIWNDKAKEINDAASSVATSAASSETSSPALSEDDTPVEKKKKKPSGYILYGGAKRAEVKEKLMSELAEGEKMPNLMAAVAAAWKAESEEVKAEWNAKAKAKSEAEDETEAK